MDAIPPPLDPPPGSPGLGPMRCSPAIDALTVALAKAQGQFPAIEKDKTARIQTKTGAAYSYAYADLATILAAVRKPLSENALAIMQPVHVNGRSVSVTTIVAHGSGQWVADALDMPISDPSDARSLASAVTYARRYGLIALLGIAPADEDDDADAATTRPASTTDRPPRSGVTKTPTRDRPPQDATSAPGVTAHGVTSDPGAPPTPALISEGQRKRFFAIAKDLGWSTAALKLWLSARAVISTHDIPQARYDALIEELREASTREPDAPAADQPF